MLKKKTQLFPRRPYGEAHTDLVAYRKFEAL